MFDRWKKAIKAEKEFWLQNGQVPLEYSEIAAKYDCLLGQIEKEIDLTDHWKILDIGCGPAPICRLLKRGEKFGLDPLVSFFKASSIGEAQDVQLIQGKAEDVPIKEKTFDLVICRNVLDHTENPNRTMDEAARVVKDNGVFLIAIYCYTRFIAHLKKIVEKGPISFLKEPYHPHFFTIYDFERLVAGNFKITRKVSVYEGRNCVDFGKITENTKMNSQCISARFISFTRLLFSSLRKKELSTMRIRWNFFVFFWYPTTFFNRILNTWYVKEFLILAEKAKAKSN